ncbi:MAG: RnfABCDGE type electron transport complex subunit G [Lachnospiraceae bacterium]|nr:RnfABCDGE type electron transport complex subunit G [Lachnospiraceae bacterium]MBR6485093.1 RnfABCDGE type electron transport complex subunit G [Lachnospiraceae bacterium]
MKNAVKSVVTLTLITVVAGLLLGYVYELTKDPIAAKELEAKYNAYRAVFPAAADFKASDKIDIASSKDVLNGSGLYKESIDECLTAVDASGKALGYVLTVTTSEGYGGDITISMGISLDGVLNGIEILSISETAGLGMKADTAEFKGQFKDKKVSQFNYTKSGASAEYEVDAISGATITTNAMVNAVNAGLVYTGSLAGGQDE